MGMQTSSRSDQVQDRTNQIFGKDLSNHIQENNLNKSKRFDRLLDPKINVVIVD